MLDYKQFIGSDSLILFLDFYKAFDSLEHSFIIQTLKHLGFGDNFCNIIQMFYADMSSLVSLGSEITPGFKRDSPRVSHFSQIIYSDYSHAYFVNN